MPLYRFHALASGDDAPIERVFFSDQVALRWAFRTTDAGGVDVWQGSRFVARLHAGVAPAPAAAGGAAAPADRDGQRA